MGIAMTTEAQNQWAQHLEDATQKEIRQMAEYAIYHITSTEQLVSLREYLDIAIADDAPSVWEDAA